VKRAALRGLILGLIASATILAMPFGFKAGMWLHSKVDPPVTQEYYLDIK
jgi:hypothetical protein